MLLEAAEDHARGYTGGGRFASERVPRKGFPIEHLLPQRWQDHWDVASPIEATTRDEYVHRIGNLTLLTTALNSSVSNGPWLGESGKRSRLHEHDVFLMNRWIRDESASGWSEGSSIDDGARLGRIACNVARSSGSRGGCCRPGTRQRRGDNP